MLIIDSMITGLSSAAMHSALLFTLSLAVWVLLTALVIAFAKLRTIRITMERSIAATSKLDEQLQHLEEMLVSTKFLTLRPEVFSDKTET